MRFCPILVVILLFNTIGIVQAHTDTLLLKGEYNRFDSLPSKYQPSGFDKNKMELKVSGNTLFFPSCLRDKFFYDVHDLSIVASWYHDTSRSKLPPYLGVKIKPQGRSYDYSLLFELGTLKPISFHVNMEAANDGVVIHKIDIGSYCIQSIKNNTERNENKLPNKPIN